MCKHDGAGNARHPRLGSEEPCSCKAIPLSVSALSGKALYLHLFKFFLSEIVSDLQLESKSLSPVLFPGTWNPEQFVFCYWQHSDCCWMGESIETILAVTGRKVVLKRTGLVLLSLSISLSFFFPLSLSLVLSLSLSPSLSLLFLWQVSFEQCQLLRGIIF